MKKWVKNVVIFVLVFYILMTMVGALNADFQDQDHQIKW